MKNEIDSNQPEFLRFGVNIRVQHLVLLISTLLLIISGVPLKFPHAGWAKFVIGILGGPEIARQFHHTGAIGLILVGFYHLLYSIFTRKGRKDFWLLIPRPNDFKDLFIQLKYFIGKSKEKARFGRFSYIEKFDYWAVYWGLLIMIGSGAIMWLFSGKFKPLFTGEIDLSWGPTYIDNYIHAIAREAHSDEALLATLAIVIWHFYNVHFNPHKFPMNKTFIHGKMTKQEMEDEHPLELEEILKPKKSEKKDEV